MFRIEMLPAAEGDCLWIEYGDPKRPRRILVDGGTTGTYERSLKPRLMRLAEHERRFELFIITHVDSDHIGGALKLLSDKSIGAQFGDIWFNGYKHLSDELGPVQGDALTELLIERGLPWNAAWNGGAVVAPDEGPLPIKVLRGGLSLTILSPTRKELAALRPVWERDVKKAGLIPGGEAPGEEEPPKPPADVLGEAPNVIALAESDFQSESGEANGSSIAVIAEHQGERCLLAGDAHAPVLAGSIRRLLSRSSPKLRLAAFKVPHHGSRNNLSPQLLALIDCDRYLFSTDGKRFGHPDWESIARVIQHGRSVAGPPTLYFNHWIAHMEPFCDAGRMEQYGYDMRFPLGGARGLTVDVE